MMSFRLLLISLLIAIGLLVLLVLFKFLLTLRFNPLQQLAGPPVQRWFGNHLFAVLEYVRRILGLTLI